jgi:uncharacterized membrane protein (DUF4010 family)
MVPMAIMLATTVILLWVSSRRTPAEISTPPPNFKLEQPFSLKAALKFGVIFLGLSIAGLLAQRSLGVFGFYTVSIAGGLLSSSSAVAALTEVLFETAAKSNVMASLSRRSNTPKREPT